MKTPREILLARHQAAEPKLAAVRERALAALLLDKSRAEAHGPDWLAACQEFFRIPRVAWGGLAAAWLVIFVLNTASRDTVAISSAPVQEAKRSPETLQALREQKRLFAELVGSAGGPDADAPRSVPRPRSEGRARIAFA